MTIISRNHHLKAVRLSKVANSLDICLIAVSIRLYMGIFYDRVRSFLFDLTYGFSKIRWIFLSYLVRRRRNDGLFPSNYAVRSNFRIVGAV